MREIYTKSTKYPVSTPVDNLFITKFMPSAPEGYVKAYLFGLMQSCMGMGGGVDNGANDGIAGGMTQAELADAFAYWEQRGLVRIAQQKPLAVEFLPVADAQDKTAASDASSSGGQDSLYKYSSLVADMQAVLSGRQLTPQELTKIYDWVEIFHFQPEAVLVLARHCAEASGSAMISINYMDAVAKDWAARGVLTAEQAQEHLAEYEARTGGAARVLKLWRQSGPPTQMMLEMYEKWHSGWGFADDAILLAARQTTSTSKPSFKYLDAILEEWHARGLTDATAINTHLTNKEYRSKAVKQQAKLIFDRCGVKRSPSAPDRELIDTWLYEWGINLEALLLAAESSAKAAMPFSYMKKVVEGYKLAGVTTLEAARELSERGAPAATSAQKPATSDDRWNIPQRTYTQEEFEQMLTPLEDDDE